MSSRPPPLRFQPLFERPEDDRAAAQQALQDVLREIAETTWKDDGHARGRGAAHAR